MKKIALLALFFAAFVTLHAQDDLYVRGDFNGWGTNGGGPMVDDGTNGDAVAGDSVFTFTVTMGTAGRSEWKIADADWNQIFPWAGGDDNAWLVTTADNQEVIFTLDKSFHNDGFEPSFNIVNANDQMPQPTSDVVAAGDFQGWNNAGSTILHDDGADGDWTANDGIYSYHYVQEAAGTYSWKPVLSGTWDTWITAGRTKSSNNMQYVTESANENVYFYLNVHEGRVATVVGEPLPVELVSFNAQQTGRTVNIIWQTASELNNSGFDLERKIKDGEWAKITFINGKGTTTEKNNYSFTDEPGITGEYFYRLKQIDNDGSYEYSGYIAVEYTAPVEFALGQNYPNPFNPVTKISFSIPEQSNVKISVYGITGEVIETLVNSVQYAGYHEVEFNASDLPSGLYIYRMEAGSLNGTNFSATGKMLLLK